MTVSIRNWRLLAGKRRNDILIPPSPIRQRSGSFNFWRSRAFAITSHACIRYQGTFQHELTHGQTSKHPPLSTHTHRRHTPPKISGGKSSSIPGNGFMDAEFSSEESEGQDKIETSKLAVKDVLATSIWNTCVFIYAVCNQEFKKGYIYCVTKHESPWEPNAAERSLPYFYLRLWMRAGISLCGWEMETQTWCGRNETSKRMQKREELLIPN